MNYRIEKKERIIMTGYKRRFTGDPAERHEQEGNFFMSTREPQYVLNALSRDLDTQYTVYTNFGDDGYDCYIAAILGNFENEHLDWVLGEDSAKKYEKIVIPEGLYLVCDTERCAYPTMLTTELRKEALNEFLPSSDYQLRNAPELSVIHWYWKEGDEKLNNSRYIEIWLPIEKK